jgi:hypothetical protein
MPSKPAKTKKLTTKSTHDPLIERAAQAREKAQGAIRWGKQVRELAEVTLAKVTKPGPALELFKIEGMPWQEAIKKSLTKKKPPEGWPKTGRGM